MFVGSADSLEDDYVLPVRLFLSSRGCWYSIGIQSFTGIRFRIIETVQICSHFHNHPFRNSPRNKIFTSQISSVDRCSFTGGCGFSRGSFSIGDVSFFNVSANTTGSEVPNIEIFHKDGTQIQLTWAIKPLAFDISVDTRFSIFRLPESLFEYFSFKGHDCIGIEMQVRIGSNEVDSKIGWEWRQNPIGLYGIRSAAHIQHLKQHFVQ